MQLVTLLPEQPNLEMKTQIAAIAAFSMELLVSIW